MTLDLNKQDPPERSDQKSDSHAPAPSKINFAAVMLLREAGKPKEQESWSKEAIAAGATVFALGVAAVSKGAGKPIADAAVKAVRAGAPEETAAVSKLESLTRASRGAGLAVADDSVAPITHAKPGWVASIPQGVLKEDMPTHSPLMQPTAARAPRVVPPVPEPELALTRHLGINRFPIDGTLDEHRIWQPNRELTEIPYGARRTLIEHEREGLLPFANRAVVSDFVRHATPLMHRFEPIEVSSYADQVLKTHGAKAVDILDHRDMMSLLQERVRTAEIERILNDFAIRQRVPGYSVRSYAEGESKTLISGKMFFSDFRGEIGVRRADALRAPGTDGTAIQISRYFHETGHARQIWDVFRVRADELGIPKTGTVSAQQGFDLLEAMSGSGLPTSGHYAHQMLKTWRAEQQPVTVVDRLRAQIVTDSMNEWGNHLSGYAQAGERIKTANQLIQELATDEGVTSVVQKLRTPKELVKVFNPERGIPEKIQQVLQGNGLNRTHTLRADIGESLEQQIDALNTQRQRQFTNYRTSFVELESWLMERRALLQAEHLLKTGN